MEPILLTLHPHKKSKEMTAHETFYLEGSKSHYLHNSGNKDARILWITAPPMF